MNKKGEDKSFSPKQSGSNKSNKALATTEEEILEFWNKNQISQKLLIRKLQKVSSFSMKVHRRQMANLEFITWKPGLLKMLSLVTKRCRVFTCAERVGGILTDCRLSFKWKKNSV